MDSILKDIKNKGYRLTKVRIAVIGALTSAKRPLTSSDIRKQMLELGTNVDRTSIYRELLFLVEKNFIKNLRFSDHKTYYEIRKGHHHHLICTSCNEVKEVVLGGHLEEQEKKIFKKENFKVVTHSLEFYGLCSNCL